MARIYCKYHPTVPARWTCRACQINFCSQCMQAEGGATPQCPVCHRPAESLGTGNVIEPFWQRLPAIFAWPLHAPPLLFMVALTVLNALLGDTLFGFLLSIVLFIVFLKYAYVVLERTAQGYLKPEPITWSMIGEELELPFKQLFVLFLLLMFNARLYAWGGAGLLLVGQILTALLLPASVMVLAVEHRLLAAINPFILLGVMRRIGTPYLLLWLFLFLLQAGLSETLFYLTAFLPAAFYMPIGNLLTYYAVLVMFHLMGYVIYQYHEALGFAIEQDYEAAVGPVVSDAAPPGLREVEILFQEGKLDEARQRLLALIEAEPGNMLYRERLHKLLLNTGDLAGLRQHSAEYIVRLLLHARPSEALRVFTECYKRDREFKFGEAKQRHQMAELLIKNGQDRAALALLNNLHRDFPHYKGIPQAYLLVARILCEKFNQDERARQVLDFIEQRYPDFPQLEEVREYRRVIEQVAASQG